MYAAKSIKDKVLPLLNDINIKIDKLADTIVDCLKNINNSETSKKQLNIVDKLKTQTDKKQDLKKPQEKKSFFESLKDKIFGKIKDASNTANKISDKIPDSVKTFAKMTPFGFLGSLAKKALDKTANKIEENQIKKDEAKLDIAAESI
jgi:hypothetical protein